MKTSIQYYHPTERFKSWNEHVCVSQFIEKDQRWEPIAITGPTETNFNNLIDTVAQSIIMGLSFKMYQAVKSKELINVDYEEQILMDNFIKTFDLKEYGDIQKIRSVIKDKLKHYQTEKV